MIAICEKPSRRLEGMTKDELLYELYSNNLGEEYSTLIRVELDKRKHNDTTTGKC